jgi:hypothetical protein
MLHARLTSLLIHAAEMKNFDHNFYQTPRFITEDIELTIVVQGKSKVAGQPVQFWIFQVHKKQSKHSSCPMSSKAIVVRI